MGVWGRAATADVSLSPQPPGRDLHSLLEFTRVRVRQLLSLALWRPPPPRHCPEGPPSSPLRPGSPGGCLLFTTKPQTPIAPESTGALSTADSGFSRLLLLTPL